MEAPPTPYADAPESTGAVQQKRILLHSASKLPAPTSGRRPSPHSSACDKRLVQDPSHMAARATPPTSPRGMHRRDSAHHPRENLRSEDGNVAATKLV